MKPNMGLVDRALRLVLGVVILLAGYYYGSYWGLVGLVPILTALIRWCPLYFPFKISTIKSE